MSDVKALFGLIDKRNKRRLIGAVICCVLSVLCGILPYLGVWGIVTCFLDERTENLFQYVCLIAAAIILKHLLFGTGTKISHKVAYQTLGETRKKLFRKIARLPMGYVKTTASGQVKTIIMDNMEQLETFYAHNIPEIISGLAVPLCMEILLVILDIRVAGIMLIPVVLFILVGILMIIVQMKKMDEFNQAFADVSVKTVEYVNGMKELKIFAADESTYGRLSESIRTYSTVVTEWFQSCLKYVAFNHADLNSNLVFLFPLAGLMYLSGSVTAASLICRFWDITEGQICMGGVPLNQIPLSDLMSQISFVTQNTFLFKKSIRDNIMMGNPEATEEEMMQAAKDAVCHDFIMRLPKGYDTVIDKETKLSGGEKQRITLARAILKNAPVVILDEATAYIDADNEDLLQKALAKLSEGKTVLVIAHRLSSIKEADSIVVLEQGKVIDCGTHDELINRCSPYQDMWAAFEQSDQWKMGGVNA